MLKENEVYYEAGKGQLEGQIERDSKKETIEKNVVSEKELADVIYIFTAPYKPGIRFYDRTPSGDEAQITGFLPEGKFITDIHSIEKAEWDEDLNKANTVDKFSTRNGSVVVKTIMVSEEQLVKIFSQIIRQKDEKRVVIDTIDRRVENRVDYEQFVQSNNNISDGTCSIH